MSEAYISSIDQTTLSGRKGEASSIHEQPFLVSSLLWVVTGLAGLEQATLNGTRPACMIWPARHCFQNSHYSQPLI